LLLFGARNSKLGGGVGSEFPPPKGPEKNTGVAAMLAT